MDKEYSRENINLKIDLSKLRGLAKELQVQTESTISQLNLLEHKLLESTLSLRSSDREINRVKHIEEISKQMNKLHEALDPLNKRKALVDALLDPSTMFWLSLRMGDHKQMVEEAIADILERDLDCNVAEEAGDDSAGEETAGGHDQKPAAEKATNHEQGEKEVPEQAKEKETEKKPHRPRRPPSSSGGAFDDLLD